MARKEPIVPDDIELDVDALLTQIREADVKQVESQMDIARLLACVKEYKLYMPTYDSFHQLVLAELDFAVSAADRYVSFYQNFTKFGYGREEMYKLMRQLGWRKVQLCLRSSKRKMSYKMMKQYLEDTYYSQDRQFNFNLRSDSIAHKLEQVLVPFGLTIGADGRRGHMTESLEALINDYERLKKRGEQMDLLEEPGIPKSTQKAKRAAAKQPVAKKPVAKKAVAKKPVAKKKALAA